MHRNSFIRNRTVLYRSSAGWRGALLRLGIISDKRLCFGTCIINGRTEKCWAVIISELCLQRHYEWENACFDYGCSVGIIMMAFNNTTLQLEPLQNDLSRLYSDCVDFSSTSDCRFRVDWNPLHRMTDIAATNLLYT